MTIYLLTSEPSEKKDQIEKIEAKLLEIIPELRKIEKIEDIAAEMRGKPDTKIVVIYLSPTLAGSAMDNFINVASRYRDRIFFILVSNAISGDDYKRLVRSGGADWVAATGSFQEISELIYKQTSPPIECHSQILNLQLSHSCHVWVALEIRPLRSKLLYGSSSQRRLDRGKLAISILMFRPATFVTT